MYSQAVGFNPKSSLLSGLKGKRNTAAGQMAYGQAMAGAADLNLARQNQNADFGMKQFEADQGLRMAKAQNSAKQQLDNSGYRVAKAGLANRKSVFDTNMNFAYDQLRKRQSMDLRQSLLNQVARSFS